MMNEAGKNAETVRRGYDAFNKADMKTLTELFHESASWHTPGRGPLAGDRKGREATFAQFGRYAGETAGTFKALLRSVAEGDDGRVVAIHRNTETSGVGQFGDIIQGSRESPSSGAASQAFVVLIVNSGLRRCGERSV
ncbi:MAG: nuclear transport factor 2 family protein [Terracidiphilus sp.]|jgi:ketosteroid isomerase-like protein